MSFTPTLIAMGCGIPFRRGNGITTGTYESTVLEDTPDIYYPGLGDTGGPKDKSGNGKNAKTKGSVETGIESGLFPCSNEADSKAINITAAGDGVISDSAASAPTGSFTIEAWVTAPLSIDADGLILFGMGKESADAAGGKRCCLWLDSGGNVRLNFLDTADALVNATWTNGDIELNGNNGEDQNQVWFLSVSYNKTTGQVLFRSNAKNTQNGGSFTVATGNTNGVKPVGTDDIRWCVGDLPSAADSDVMSGTYGAAQARIHDVAFFPNVVSDARLLTHYNKARIPCSGNHPFVYKINQYSPIFWATGDQDASDQITSTSATAVSGATFANDTALGDGDTSYCMDLTAGNSAAFTWDGASIDSNIANLFTNSGSTNADRKVMMMLAKASTVPAGQTIRLVGTATSTLNDGWDIYDSSSGTAVFLRQRNTSTEEYFGNITFATVWRLFQWRYYYNLSEAGMNWASGGYFTASVTNGGSGADASGNDLWLGLLPGGTGVAFDGYVQHLCMFNADMADYIMLDFYNAFAYDGDVSQ